LREVGNGILSIVGAVPPKTQARDMELTYSNEMQPRKLREEVW